MDSLVNLPLPSFPPSYQNLFVLNFWNSNRTFSLENAFHDALRRELDGYLDHLQDKSPHTNAIKNFRKKLNTLPWNKISDEATTYFVRGDETSLNLPQTTAYLYPVRLKNPFQLSDLEELMPAPFLIPLETTGILAPSLHNNKKLKKKFRETLSEILETQSLSVNSIYEVG